MRDECQALAFHEQKIAPSVVSADALNEPRMKDQLESERCARYMKALSEGDRLKIIQTLLEGPRSVGDVAELMHSPLQNISHHLRCLANAGLLDSRREGKFIYYAINPKIYRKATARKPTRALEFGCCRIELGG